jgi:hypothetical protein
MTVLIQLSAVGINITLFDIYSNIDYGTPIVTGISKMQLLEGYSLLNVPDNATTIRLSSTGTCSNYTDIAIGGLITTTTTTSTTLNCSFIVNAQEITTTSTSTSSTSTSTSSTSTTTTTTTSAPLPEGTIVLRNDINIGSGQTLNSLSNFSWTTLAPSAFPIPQNTNRFGGHFGYSGNLTINATVNSSCRVEITVGGNTFCQGVQGTGSINYVFTGITILPTDDVTIELTTGDVCP